MAPKADKFDLKAGTAIVFVLPGHIVDTRLKVFDTEFHVHSLILKIGSGFFRAFLDSPDKDKTSEPSGRFRYDYDTAIDADGVSWGLEVASKLRERGGNQAAYSGKWPWTDHAGACLRTLQALYHLPLSDIPHQATVQHLVGFADFYRCLPYVSNALNGAFVGYRWSSRIPEHLPDYLRLAIKLRNKTLYKECMVHVVGQWEHQDEKTGRVLKDHPEVRKQAENAHANVCAKIVHANHTINKMFGIDTVKSPTQGISWPESLAQAQRLVISERVQFHMCRMARENHKTYARFFRELFNDPFTLTGAHTAANWHVNFQLAGADISTGAKLKVQPIIGPLLKNNLKFDQSGWSTGTGDYEDCFLCAEILDENLPWDVNQVDW